MRAVIGMAAAALLLGGCDYSGDWLFAGAVEGLPGVIHLGELEPSEIDSPADIDDSIIFGEIGATGTVDEGGVTFTFRGTGDSVCLWVDPELAFWNPSVSASSPVDKWAYPDNLEDDGDIDMSAGYAVYYTGSPGETVGGFEIRYQDSLGEDVPIELNECVMYGYFSQDGAHAGRGYPEYCELQATAPDVSYMVLLKNWSTPLDDDRLSYGFLVSHGSCNNITTTSGRPDECVIRGEALEADAAGAPGPWLGRSEAPTIAGSVEFEEAFCDPTISMVEFCEAEAATKNCREERCFCGDPTDMPTGGSI